MDYDRTDALRPVDFPVSGPAGLPPMNFSRDEADVYVPGGGSAEEALARVTHLCIGAHQDDIEIMAHDAICDCLDDPTRRAFGGVVVTDGAGSPRRGPYAGLTDLEMRRMRRDEQRRAAEMGRYAIQIQLAHPSAAVKQSGDAAVAADLGRLLASCRPGVLYVHNPADKHDTHVAVFLRVLSALRALPETERPARVLGVEVWRGLDWLVEADKVALDSGRRPELATRLLEAFDSQIFGGKRYDLATEGRRAANATYHDAHATDHLQALTWAMDLTPLVADPTLDVIEYTVAYVDRLRSNIVDRITRFQ